ncbi:MAG: glycoside hydrolase family 3 C-terminal domain-containing protein [Jatrophihabitantaceae bacterium]
MADTDSPDYQRLVSSLDLDRKVGLLTGASTFTLAAEPAIGLAELRMSDGPTGVRGLKFSGGRTVALLPNATLLASAWDPESTYEAGQILAEEALAQQIHLVLGPTINLHRSALGGRLFEAYSEDPLLTGVLAASYVRGLQSAGVGACLKHLVANESETERNTVSSVVDEATLREVYLLPFEIAVTESDPWSIMTAYNDVNGVPASEQLHVNSEIVKGEWGYPGLLMSDWFATKSAAAAANGGLDLVMPGPDGPWGAALVAAVRAGEVAEAVIDDHLTRLLRLADRVGVLGLERSYPTGLPAPDSLVRKEQLSRLAAAGMTVLRNRADVLPLREGQPIALIGRHAIETIDMGGGSAQVNPPYQVSIAEALTGRLGAAVSVIDGVEVRTRSVPARPDFVSDPRTGAPGVRFTLLGFDGAVIEERVNAAGSTVIGFDDDLAATVHTVRLTGRVAASESIEFGVIGVGDWRLRAGDWADQFSLDVAGAGFAEEMLAPPTRTERIEVSAGDVLEATVQLAGADPDRPLAGSGLFALIARSAPQDAQLVIDRAVAAARTAELTVLVVGLTEEQETEAVDKDTLRLPGRQDELVSAVAAIARHTVVVVNSATPVLMPWLDAVDAVLWAGLPGQEGGHAVAAALFGDIEPAGRLVTSFPAEDGAAPAWSVTPVDGELPYTEGTFIGYRGYHAGLAASPAFWFGHGLGYTSWDYGEPELLSQPESSDPGGGPVVRVRITNTGRRTSREVVQVYFEPATGSQPIRLVGWAAASVAPGQSAQLTVRTDPRMWRRWDVEAGAWAQLASAGRLIIARGLGDQRGSITM